MPGRVFAAPLTCVFAGRVSGTSPWPMRGVTHQHELVEMVVLFAGQLDLHLGGERFGARAGDVLYYPSRIAHSEEAAGDGAPDFIYFAVSQPFRETRPRVTHDASGRLRVLSKWLLEERSAPGPGRTEITSALLAAILAEHSRAQARITVTLAARARAFMKARLESALKVEDLARATGLSRAHFIRAYHEEAGRPPMTDLRRLRLEAARDLLITTHLPLKAIAPRVGLADEHHLSRLFRRVFGVPTGYYRPKRVGGGRARKRTS